MLNKSIEYSLEDEKKKTRLGKTISRSIIRFGFISAYSFARSHLVSQQVAILVYHRIDKPANHPWSQTPINPEDFDKEMKFLRRNYHILSLGELVTSLIESKNLPRNAAVVTIDDGYRDNYIHAYPILRKYQIPATIFLATGLIDTGVLLWLDRVRYAIWNTGLTTLNLDELGIYHLNSNFNRRQAAFIINAKLKKLPIKNRDEFLNRIIEISNVDIPSSLGRELFLSWDEVREMSRNGINFGAHTVNHPILSKLPLDEAEKEIMNSKQQIENQTDQEVSTFCYPNGEPEDFNTDIEKILMRNGFKCAVTLVPGGFVSPRSQLYSLPRIIGATNPETFRLLISGLYLDAVRIRRRLGGYQE